MTSRARGITSRLLQAQRTAAPEQVAGVRLQGHGNLSPPCRTPKWSRTAREYPRNSSSRPRYRRARRRQAVTHLRSRRKPAGRCREECWSSTGNVLRPFGNDFAWSLSTYWNSGSREASLVEFRLTSLNEGSLETTEDAGTRARGWRPSARPGELRDRRDKSRRDRLRTLLHLYHRYQARS